MNNTFAVKSQQSITNNNTGSRPTEDSYDENWYEEDSDDDMDDFDFDGDYGGQFTIFPFIPIKKKFDR